MCVGTVGNIWWGPLLLTIAGLLQEEAAPGRPSIQSQRLVLQNKVCPAKDTHQAGNDKHWGSNLQK
jgi:hypothetical protein